MVVFWIIFAVVIIGAGILVYFNKEKIMGFFGNSITRKVEKYNKLMGTVEVLKKQQKVNSESVLKAYAVKQADLTNSVNAEVARLQAQINSLKDHKKAQSELLEEERKVAIDKTINDFDQRIANIKNRATKLMHLIEAEKKNMEDVINPTPINAPSTSTLKVVTTVEPNVVKQVTKKKPTKKTSK